MARPCTRSEEDRKRANEMQWPDLQTLWDDIINDRTTVWSDGKALEYLVVRGLELSNLNVRYPYDVPPGGRPIEQIDGMVYLGDVPFLIECKDRRTVDIESIAKLHGQLLRRPPTTMGCVFVSGRFTDPALVLADLATPHRITLWTGNDIQQALAVSDFQGILRQKYEDLCMYGLNDYSPNYRTLEVKGE